MESPRISTSLEFFTTNPTRCITSATVRRAELEWTIQNFGFKCKNKKAGDFLKSVNFCALEDKEIKWHLKLYPNGEDDDNKGSVGLYACPATAARPASQVSINFSILDGTSAEELFSQTYNYKFLSGEADGYGCASCIRQDKFSGLRNAVVRCKLEYEVETLGIVQQPFISSSLESDLTKDLVQLFHSMADSDVTFVVSDEEIKAHKSILAARSPVFAAMFRHDMRERGTNRVEIAEMEPDVFQAVLRFIYTDQVEDLSFETAKSLLSAASRYILGGLKRRCEAFLIQHLAAVNCSELLMLADIHEAANLKKAAVNVIRQNSAEVKKSEGWKNLVKHSRAELFRELIGDFIMIPA